jgi:hypothetical protein
MQVKCGARAQTDGKILPLARLFATSVFAQTATPATPATPAAPAAPAAKAEVKADKANTAAVKASGAADVKTATR